MPAGYCYNEPHGRTEENYARLSSGNLYGSHGDIRSLENCESLNAGRRPCYRGLGH